MSRRVLGFCCKPLWKSLLLNSLSTGVYELVLPMATHVVSQQAIQIGYLNGLLYGIEGAESFLRCSAAGSDHRVCWRLSLYNPRRWRLTGGQTGCPDDNGACPHGELTIHALELQP